MLLTLSIGLPVAFEEFLKVFRKLHTKTVCSRIKADLVSMTTAVTGRWKENQEGRSLSIHARFEKLNRLGGSEAVVFEVIPRGLREAQLSQESKQLGSHDIVSARRSYRMESLRMVSNLSDEFALKIFRLNKYSSVIAKKVSLELKNEIKLIEKLDHPYILKVSICTCHASKGATAELVFSPGARDDSAIRPYPDLDWSLSRWKPSVTLSLHRG